MDYKKNEIEVETGREYGFTVYYTKINNKRLLGYTDTMKEAYERGERFIDTYENVGVLKTPIKYLKWYNKLWVVPLNNIILLLIKIIDKIGEIFNDNKN